MIVMLSRITRPIAGLLLAVWSVGASTARADEPRVDPIEAVVPGIPAAPRSFTRDVLPALTKAGCNAGACHGSFQGRGGFRLSLLGFDPAFDYEAIVKGARGRRVSLAAPGSSLLLEKPSGRMPHQGGVRFSIDSPAYAVIRDWIAQGVPVRTLEPERLALEITVPAAKLSLGAQTRLDATATFADGERRDVTAWALWDSSDPRVIEVSRTGVVKAAGPGRASVIARHLGQVAVAAITVPFSTTSTTEVSGAIDSPGDLASSRERLAAFVPVNEVDRLVAAEWRELGVGPAELVDDTTFLRRVSIDLTGTLPAPSEVRAFLADTHPDKRARKIDELLERSDYVDYWTLRWGDLLRAHRRYLGDKGLASFSGWIRDQIRHNRPLDQMCRDLLTAQGNLYTNGPVGFYFVDEKVEDLTETAAQVLLGVRLQCTRCHHHPLEVWSQEDYYGLAAFFTRIETKDSGLIGSRFGGPKSLRPIANPHPSRTLAMNVAPKLLGSSTEVPNRQTDVRVELADWLVAPDNAYFSRNLVNRYWNALFGRGLIDPVDDIRATNPPLMPNLLDGLAADFRAHGYDARRLLRMICNSRVYQLAAATDSRVDDDGRLLTHRVARRMTAEVLLDALNAAAGTQERFPGQPVGTRAIQLADPTIPSYFLTAFGRPTRNNPCECARSSQPDLAQSLHMINSVGVHEKVAHPEGRVAKLLNAGRSDDELTDELYLATLSRLPTADERAVVKKLVQHDPQRAEAWQDVLWALVNSGEFGMVR